MQKTMKCGILSLEEYKERTMKIVRGEYRPGPNEPKIWFESLNAMAQILNSENIELLRIIEKEKPDSITRLSALSGRKKGNLSRTLKKLHAYGIVDLEKNRNQVRPIAKATDFQFQFGVYSSFDATSP